MKKRIAYYALGCKLNFSEASSLTADFYSHQYENVPFKSEADVYIINTCSVTETANAKSRKAISKAIRKNPNAIIIVTGCYAQLKPHEIAEIQGVDYIFGTGQKQEIEAFIDQLSKQKTPQIIRKNFKSIDGFYPSWSSGERTRSFLKIQDGCDNFCSYCTIPFARGRSRNISIEKIVEQAHEIVDAGFKEIILTGVNIGDFGKTTGESFGKLIQALSEVEEVERYRVSSIEPDLLHDEIIDFMIEHPKFMPHFHIPLQSGSDDMLKIMNRKYDTSLFRHKIEYIKQKDPNAFTGIDLIVGVPGETETLFKESYNFAKSLDVSFIHVFTYSEREGTRAVKMEPKVNSEIKKQRSDLMHELSESKHLKFNESQIGSTRPVLFEHSKKGKQMFGFTDNYVRVGIPFDRNLINNISSVFLENLSPENFINGKL